MARSSGLVLLQTARAMASGKEGGASVNIRILFDTGSQRSYVTEALCSRLRLKPVKKERLHLNTFGEPAFKGKTCDLVQIRLQKIGSSDCLVLEALSFPTICSSLPNVVHLDKYPQLCDLQLADPPGKSTEVIDLLVGSDHYWNIVEEETIRTDNGPTTVRSKVGWLLSGPLTSPHSHVSTFSHLAVCQGFNELEPSTNELSGLNDILKSFWELESLGIYDTQYYKEPVSFLDGVTFVQGRYEVGLPWIRSKSDIPDHFNLCYNRLRYLQRRLIKQPEILKEYQNTIDEQLRYNIIEPVSNSIESSDTFIHYMPHHPVVKQGRSTTKVRVVYDGSATSHECNIALNDCLQVGPNLIPKLFNVLIRF